MRLGKRSLAVATIAMMLGPSALTGGPQAAPPKDAGSALKAVRGRYRKVETLRASFIERFQWKMTGETVERSGTLAVGKENKFRITTPEQLIVCDGKVLYRHNLIRDQVMIEPVENSETLLPKRLLLNFADEFAGRSVTPLAVAGQEGFRLELVPVDPDQSLLASASVWVTTANLTIHRLQIVDQNGNSTDYELSGIVFDGPVAAAETSFSLPEGVEVFDLR